VVFYTLLHSFLSCCKPLPRSITTRLLTRLI